MPILVAAVVAYGSLTGWFMADKDVRKAVSDYYASYTCHQDVSRGKSRFVCVDVPSREVK